MKLKMVRFLILFQGIFFAFIVEFLGAYNLHSVGGNLYHWTYSDVGFKVHIDGSNDFSSPPTTEIFFVKKAFDEWDNVTPSKLEFTYQGTTDQKHNIDGSENVVYWIEYPGFSVGTAQMTVNTSTGEFIDVDIRMNDSKTWSTDTFNWADSIFDIQSIVTHEAGHLIGIDHPGSNNDCATMWNGWNSAPCKSEAEDDLEVRSLEQDDKNAINALHTAPSAPTGFSVSGSVGNNPQLNWNANSESDLEGYYIYRKLSDSQSQFYLIDSVAAGTTNYTDTDITISGSRFSPLAYYYIKAYDFIHIVSGSSTTRSIKYNPSKILLPATNLPTRYKLENNIPNPFNPITTIEYDLPEWSFVEMRVYNLMGREIRTLLEGNAEAGYKTVIWDGKDAYGNPVASGMYLYRIDVISYENNEEFHQTKKMVLLR